MIEDKRCFIMLCLKATQQECIDRQLFGEVERTFDLIKGLKPGDIGFLFNMDTNSLIGPFEAVSEPGYNLEPAAWKGKYPAQIRVKSHLRHLKQIDDARQNLEGIGIKFDELRLGKLQPRLPVHDAAIAKRLMDYVLENGTVFSETSIDQAINETGNEVIDLYSSELPDSYLKVLNEVAIETQQRIYEELPTKGLPTNKRDGLCLDVPKPFNICVLGEVTDEAQIRVELAKYFQKRGVSELEWNIEFYNNKRIEQGTLSSLKSGQSRFNLIITGQIYHHSLRGAKIANIFSELDKGNCVDHVQGSDPQKKLTVDITIETVHKYINRLQVKKD
jgi:hypothetical protein